MSEPVRRVLGVEEVSVTYCPCLDRFRPDDHSLQYVCGICLPITFLRQREKAFETETKVFTERITGPVQHYDKRNADNYAKGGGQPETAHIAFLFLCKEHDNPIKDSDTDSDDRRPGYHVAKSAYDDERNQIEGLERSACGGIRIVNQIGQDYQDGSKTQSRRIQGSAQSIDAAFRRAHEVLGVSHQAVDKGFEAGRQGHHIRQNALRDTHKDKVPADQVHGRLAVNGFYHLHHGICTAHPHPGGNEVLGV